MYRDCLRRASFHPVLNVYFKSSIKEMPSNRNCCIVGCHTTAGKCRGLSFFSIPKAGKSPSADEWRADLIRVINRCDSSFNPKNASICSRHFEEKDFKRAPSGRCTGLVSLPVHYMPQKSFDTRKTTRPEPTTREPPPVSERVCYTSFEDLSNDAIKSLPVGWVMMQRNTSRLQIGLSSSQDQCSIVVNIEGQHFLADVKVLGMPAAHLQVDLETKKLGIFLRELQAQAVCPGITSSSLQQFAAPPPPPDGKTGYFQHLRYSSNDGIVQHTACVRSVQCELLVQTDKSCCRSCQPVHDILQEKRARQETEKAIKPNDSLRGLSKDQLKEAFKAERETNSMLEKQAEEFKAKIASEPEDLHEDLQQAMSNLQDPLQRLFWQEQLKAFEKKENGMRWHPLMIRLATLIHSKSEAAYETLRKTGVLKLPGKSTLREYTAATESQSGFQPEVVEELKKHASQLPENQRFVVLLHDEMTIKSDLVFESRSGQLVGFVHSDKDCNLKLNKKLATHALVFYVVGINSNVKMSLGFFQTRSATADQLYPLFWQAVACLEEAGFQVVVSTSDKAPPNQRLYQMMGDPDQVVYKTVNLLASERWIFFISDPPHLIKTVRNNLSNSAEGSTTRCLWNNAHHILWKHFSQLYHQDMEMGVARSGLTLEHIRLNPHSIMNVRLAAQTLSSRVAAVMQTYGGLECQETATFVKLMDRFFDCLNTRHLHEAEHKRKPDLMAYTDANDERFRFLQEDFLGYLFQWKASVENRPGFSRAEKAKMYLSYQTHRGLVMTVNGFIEATKFLLAKGVRFVLSNKFCQDPIEEHFGRHRAMGRTSENPNALRFAHQEKSLRLQRQLALTVTLKGNVHSRPHQQPAIPISGSPLKKKARKKKKLDNWYKLDIIARSGAVKINAV